MAALEHRADPHGEILPATPAALNARARAPFCGLFLGVALGALHAMFPSPLFDEFTSSVFIGETFEKFASTHYLVKILILKNVAMQDFALSISNSG
ncbi:MAG: hypothetical protein M2R45_01578 [Verrucomicrobia subdivision 3 bacterium]|nr:hypothetical protein [Limisphaerales bacterium]